MFNLGVSHGDDASLVFKLPYLESKKAKKDQAMRDDLIKLWSSFAEKGLVKKLTNK